MRSIWTQGLALSLGLFVTAANTRGDSWRAPPARPATTQAPVASLGRPIATSSKHVTPSGPAAVMGKPVPLARAGEPDRDVQAVTFTRPADPLAPVVRGAAPEQIPHRPMPLAGGEPGSPPTLHGWKRGDEVVATAPRSGAIVSTPAPSGPGLPGMVVSTPAGPAPLFTGLPNGGCSSGCGPCASSACCWGDGDCIGPRLSVNVEYLLWWMKGDGTPPLVTTGNPGADGAFTGALGESTTQVLYGGRMLGRDGMSGTRLTIDYFFSDNRLWGLQLGGFFVGENQDRFAMSSPGIPVLARPIFEQTPGQPRFPGGPSTELIAFPTVVAGSVNVERNSILWGYDVNFKRNLCCGPNGYVDFLFGYRQMALDESLTIQESLTSLAADDRLGPVGTGTFVEDKFSASNRFYGGQIGLDCVLQRGAWSLGFRGRVALGNTTQIVQIDGTTTRQLPPAFAPATGTGGLLASPTNIGRYTRDMFGIIPEVGLTLGYQVTDWLRLTAGYNFLYWNNVARPGEQIDLQVNRNFQPFAPAAPTGPARPAFSFSGSDFYAHGLTLGMEFRY